MTEIEIRDKPQLKTILRKITESSFTTIMWVLYSYLFIPVLNIILWLLGIRYLYVALTENVDYMEILDLIGKMGWIVLIIFGLLRLWGYYNLWRFGKRDRRKAVPYNNIEQLAGFFQVPIETVLDLQLKKEVLWPIQQNQAEEARKVD